MNAAILAIGTEICLGQITNRNASWLAQRLHELGVFSPYHRTVPDDRGMIAQELRDLAARAEILVITGGLGPTSDDFTRDCVAEFLGRPLRWDEESWIWIQDRLRERGIVVRDFQRQQCYYPAGAQVLKNQRGTAHGFHVETPDFAGPLRHVFVLPGPPAEVESVFENGVRPVLEPLKETLDPLQLKIWDCIGVGESDVAHRAEKALEGCPFEKAYRVHLPYVEFKLIFPYSRKAEAAPWIAKVDASLADWVALTDGADAAAQWIARLEAQTAKGRWLLIDQVTQGLFPARVATLTKNREAGRRLNLLTEAVPSTTDDILMTLAPVDEFTCEVALQNQGRREVCQIAAPLKAAALAERRRQYFLEAALLFWTKSLASPETAARQSPV